MGNIFEKHISEERLESRTHKECLYSKYISSKKTFFPPMGKMFK